MDTKTKSNPYSEYEYQSMRDARTWGGGWVRSSEATIYITSSGHVEQDRSAFTLGQEENPFSYEAYNEMNSCCKWDGGWVTTGQYSCPIYYRSNNNASGCGSKSGSRSGSDSGCNTGTDGAGDGKLIAGSGIASRFANSNGHIVVSWTSGYTTRSPFSHPSVSAVIASNGEEYSVTSQNLYCQWIGLYGIIVTGSFTYEYHPFGSSEKTTHSVEITGGSFTVPTEFRE